MRNSDVRFGAWRSGGFRDTKLSIHPNFDIYDQHLNYIFNIDNQKKVIKFIVVGESNKGKFTYDYFRLNELEIDTLNQAQGAKKKEELTDQIDPEIKSQLESIFKQL